MATEAAPGRDPLPQCRHCRCPSDSDIHRTGLSAQLLAVLRGASDVPGWRCLEAFPRKEQTRPVRKGDKDAR
eukprot:CAMPEP_0197899776 /NCGR_PEP_ID=MMETSP1439-20131203/47370_1 /TAXON_ID=66791 /ORGANISM="Gonyaulax spinifera, Strain CCMP409" /LENGTH=71 /DNA_ID=CAMNT_0043520605 /DNA_START=25 /DNA_END=237 /DNA_ORIENTATION=+